MSKTRIIVPYFGKLPEIFPIWLKSCSTNKDIEWLIITDDTSKYNYPKNVDVNYISWEDIKLRIQKLYDFEIILDKPYKLCDYRVAYGEIFEEELEKYDFWGYCDLDVIFGDISKFITKEILDTYDKIQWRGHLTLYRNTKEVNRRYRLPINGNLLYKEIFTKTDNCFFDEDGIDKIYEQYEFSVYKETNFADLKIRSYNFFLLHFPKEYDYKNKHQIFVWDRGKLTRLYIENNKIKEEEFMYIHFLKRKIDCSKINLIEDRFVIMPNKLVILNEKINEEYIMKNSKNKFYFDYYLPRLKPNFILNKIKKKVC